jgi:hypothetical protein
MPVDTPDARDAAHPCRPTISCTADIVAPGRLEVEVGGLATSTAAGAHVLATPLLLKQTITPLVQIQVGSNGYTWIGLPPETKYLDNVVFGPKVHLADQGDILPSLALAAQLGLPTLDAAGYAHHDDAFVTAFASKDVGFLHFDWNVGAQLWGLEAAAATQLFTALAMSPALPAPFGFAVEGYCFSDAPPLAPHDGGVRSYVSVAPRPWLVFDAGGDVGFFPSARAYSLFLGMTVVPVVFWRPAAVASR